MKIIKILKETNYKLSPDNSKTLSKRMEGLGLGRIMVLPVRGFRMITSNLLSRHTKPSAQPRLYPN